MECWKTWEGHHGYEAKILLNCAIRCTNLWENCSLLGFIKSAVDQKISNLAKWLLGSLAFFKKYLLPQQHTLRESTFWPQLSVWKGSIGVAEQKSMICSVQGPYQMLWSKGLSVYHLFWHRGSAACLLRCLDIKIGDFCVDNDNDNRWTDRSHFTPCACGQGNQGCQGPSTMVIQE